MADLCEGGNESPGYLKARNPGFILMVSKTVNAERYQDGILTPFFYQLTEEESSHVWFQQDSAPADTAEDSLLTISEVFADRLIRAGLFPPRSPDLIPLKELASQNLLNLSQLSYR
ncbi:hypothetical protein ANN_27853 [Periplaneta americana]|uniref:Uncharacterized protein n=1 Tax=Periplaneta americana TaxID=6978 RepID=A0ABQ8RVL6_PERAM|nr:hypothetical protein ANN_27853 [Periplaneta americana]